MNHLELTDDEVGYLLAALSILKMESDRGNKELHMDNLALAINKSIIDKLPVNAIRRSTNKILGEF